MSSLSLRTKFSFWFVCERDRKLAAVFFFPRVYVIVKLNCGTKSHAVSNGGGIFLVWKNRFTVLLSVGLMTVLVFLKIFVPLLCMPCSSLKVPWRKMTFSFVREQMFCNHILLGHRFCVLTYVFDWNYLPAKLHILPLENLLRSLRSNDCLVDVVWVLLYSTCPGKV